MGIFGGGVVVRSVVLVEGDYRLRRERITTSPH